MNHRDLPDAGIRHPEVGGKVSFLRPVRFGLLLKPCSHKQLAALQE